MRPSTSARPCPPVERRRRRPDPDRAIGGRPDRAAVAYSVRRQRGAWRRVALRACRPALRVGASRQPEGVRRHRCHRALPRWSTLDDGRTLPRRVAVSDGGRDDAADAADPRAQGRDRLGRAEPAPRRPAGRRGPPARCSSNCPGPRTACDFTLAGPCGQIATYAIERFLAAVTRSSPQLTRPARLSSLFVARERRDAVARRSSSTSSTWTRPRTSSARGSGCADACPTRRSSTTSRRCSTSTTALSQPLIGEGLRAVRWLTMLVTVPLTALGAGTRASRARTTGAVAGARVPRLLGGIHRSRHAVGEHRDPDARCRPRGRSR